MVVSELTEYLDRRFPDAAGKGGPERWQTRHPLQPFSPRYFQPDEPALFSYSAPMAAAATALGADGGGCDRFAGELEAAQEVPEIELDDLIGFAVSPSRHFVRRRLGLHLEVRDDELSDDEPFQLDALQAWQLKSDLADWGKPGEDRAAHLAAAGGLLPPGNMADIQHRESAGEVARLQEALLPYRDHSAAAEVDIAIDGIRVVGTVNRFHGEQNELVWWRVGAIRAKDRIAVWLQLLALTAARDCRLTAYLFGSKDGAEPSTLAGPSPEQARELLGDWIAAWQEGRRKPLPFFAHTSWEWTARQSSSAVASAWAGQPWSEGNDPVHRTIFGDDPVDDSFKDLCRSPAGAVAGSHVMNKAGLTPLAAPLDGGLLVEASAGTGKTYTLTTLAARLVVEAGHRIDDLLIVTFTVAATGELRTPHLATLHAARAAVRDAAAGADDQARELAAHWRRLGIESPDARLTRAIRDFDRANITTIHGFLPARAGGVRATRRAPVRVRRERRRGA